MTLQKNATKKSVNTVKNVNTDVQSSLTLDKIKNALAQVNGCLENINRIKTIILRLNSAHKNHKMWIKITSLLMRKELDKSSDEYNYIVNKTIKANNNFNKSFQIDEDHIKLFENVIQVSCKVCFDYCSDEVKEIVKKSLESTHNYIESVEYLIVYLNQVKQFIIKEKNKLKIK